MVISRSKPHIHPVEVMPVLPDSNMWKYPCAQVMISKEYQNFVWLFFYDNPRLSLTLTQPLLEWHPMPRWNRWDRL